MEAYYPSFSCKEVCASSFLILMTVSSATSSINTSLSQQTCSWKGKTCIVTHGFFNWKSLKLFLSHECFQNCGRKHCHLFSKEFIKPVFVPGTVLGVKTNQVHSLLVKMKRNIGGDLGRGWGGASNLNLVQLRVSQCTFLLAYN